MEKENPYRFEERVYNDGIFSNGQRSTVDATYIIHLEGNERLKKVNHELDMIHPTNLVFILHNKGFRGGGKAGFIKSAPQDLIDCYIQVFKHARERKYENILVLEDDFFWNMDILEKDHITDISNFLLEKRGKDFLYLLGCLPVLQIPATFTGEHCLGLSLGTHAVIYSRKCRERVLDVDQSTMGDWDVFHNFNSLRYFYYQPLCYQLFPNTENQTKWLSGYLPTVLQMAILYLIVLPFFRILSLDEKVDPGYTFFYRCSLYISILSMCLILLIVYSIYQIKWFKRNVRLV